MSVPPGPAPGQSLEDWVRESLLGPLPGDPEPPAPPDGMDGAPGSTAPDRSDEPPPTVPAQRVAPPTPPVLVPAQRVAPQARSTPDAGSTGAAVEVAPRISEPPSVAVSPTRRRVALGAATGVAAALGLAMVTVTPTPSLRGPDRPGAILDAAPTPGPALTSVASAPALPAAVPVAFAGGRVDVGGGWRIAVTKPYLCPVLMTVPALMSGDSRLVRMTITIVNDTGAPQQARAWTLQATADGSPAEMVLWPSAGFRGVPDRVLAPGERVRFLVAVRLPAQRVAVEVAAAHPSGTRATLTGRV